MWKFSYSFHIMAIFYFINWIVATETIERGKLFAEIRYACTSFLKRLANCRRKLTPPYDGTKLQDWAISVGTCKWGPEAILLFHVDGCGSSIGARFSYRINLYCKIVIKNSSLLSLSLIKGAKIILSENLGKHKGSRIYITMTSRISP